MLTLCRRYTTPKGKVLIKIGVSNKGNELALASGNCAAWLLAGPGPMRNASHLVIGNAAYRSGPLAIPVNDARAMATRLRTLGFDLIERENLRRVRSAASTASFAPRSRQAR
jgi:hypothetical protein